MSRNPAIKKGLAMLAISDVGVLCALVLAVALFFALEPAFLSDRNVRERSVRDGRARAVHRQ